MFDEGQRLPSPYHRTKFESEKIVREESEVPWRVYRPAIVVGHSETGAMDKIDGPYYFFPLLKRMRDSLPGWVPLVGVDLGDTNVVPVDYVAKAMDHIAHQPDLDGQAFHLVNPEPLSTVGLINSFAGAAKAPQFAVPDRPERHLQAAHRSCSPASLRPANLIGAALRMPPVHIGAEPDDRSPRHPAGGARARVVPVGLRLAVHREGAPRLRHLGARPRLLRLARCGRSGRRCSTTPIKSDSVDGQGADRQDRRHHRRLLGHRPGDRRPGRQGRRHPDPGRPRAGEARGHQAADREPGRHGVQLSLRPLRPARHRRADQAAVRGLRPHRLRGQQRRPLDPAIVEAQRGPVPRLRAHHAAQLLRRDPAGAWGSCRRCARTSPATS